MEVVSASHGVLGPLLGKLTALLANECTRLKGVRREIRSLRSELTSMQAAVQKYSMLQDPDVQAKAWISLVRELAYDTEDVIDKFIHQLGDGGHQSQSGFKEFFRKTIRGLKTLGSRHGIASQIDDLKVRVKEVKELKNSYKLDDTARSTYEHSAVDPRLSALFVEETHLVGIDGPRDDLINWLTEDSSAKHRRVLSIVGFGGLGKTTLAKEINHKIRGHFDCHAFVSVSQQPNVKKIMKDVISQVPCKKDFTEDIDTWDEKKIIGKLRELLQDKRYLIIIDDIWSILAWDAIKYAFPENNFSSRIIATTRIVDVARSCCLGGNDRMYEMEALSDLHSKKLFFKRTFGSEDCCPDVLKEVSNEILKKCGGLPLAIISISSLLAHKPFKDEWEKVRRSIGSALDKNRSLEGMNSILCLSYNDLPTNLKTCLLYLSIFPEDYVIERERLVRRWIAEGFICHLHNDILQEVLQEKSTAELWLKLESICMSKDLTSKMHMKMKLFTLKMKEGDSVMSHLSVFKEIVADLVSMEVKYDDEDLGLLLLCSLPNSYANFRDTILLSRDELTLAEVYEALQYREKMKGMVQSNGLSSSKGEASHVRDKFEHRSSNNNSNSHDKSYDGRGRSKSKPPKMFCKYCKKKNHFIEDCKKLQNKEKRKGNPDGNASIVSGAENSDSGDCLVVLAGCVASHEEWILDSVYSFQFCTNRNWLSSYKPVQKGDVVRMGDDNPCDIVGIGYV